MTALFEGAVLHESRGAGQGCELDWKQGSKEVYPFVLRGEPLWGTRMAGLLKLGKGGPMACPGEGYAIWQFR